MLKITAIDVNGNEIQLPKPLSLSINQDAEVPADDLSVTFSYIENLTELDCITVKDSDIVVFKGLVDEQQSIVDNNCAYTKLIARSMAAVLLDNESKPVNYTNPSESVIFSKHIEPYGITEYKGNNKVYLGVMNISKGTTCWQSLYKFCINTYGTIPRIEPDGTLNFYGAKNNNSILFDNTQGVKYYSLKENYKRCKLISNVFVKAPEKESYDTEFVNTTVLDKNIKRSRYIDGFVNSNALNVAEKIINTSVDDSYELTLISPCALLNILGSNATITDDVLGEISNLYVNSIHYCINSDGEYTVVRLKKENKNVVN